MLLEVQDLRKEFPGTDGPVFVLDGISFSLSAGETLALTGESGSGKSTLLHIVGGLEPPTSGSVRIDGSEIVGADDAALARLRRSEVALVFQQFNLIPSLTVAQNLSFQARIAEREDPEWIERLAERLGLKGQLAKYPEDLSGGQQQRVAIGRALAARPRLLLADEPTGNLDETTGDAVFDLLLTLREETGAGLLLVTHSERLAARADRRMHLHYGHLE